VNRNPETKAFRFLLSNLVPQSPALIQFRQPERDILAQLLADRRSPNTQRAYAYDLKHFFRAVAASEPTSEVIAAFLQLPRAEAIALVLDYKAGLLQQGLSGRRVNRSLAAIKALVRFAEGLGKCQWNLGIISGEKISNYRDTSGISREEYKKIIAICNRHTLKGKRDYALLRLLWDNALRREETRTAIADFNPTSRTLQIIGKGKGTQVELVSLSQPTTEAIAQWLAARGEVEPTDPLWIALDSVHYGHRLTGDGLYKIVRGLAAQAGIQKRFSPHRARHSSLTDALDRTGGDVRRVQKLSRHANIQTLMIYDDNRQNHQAEITELLAEGMD
jgi:integrase/recombinase XerC